LVEICPVGAFVVRNKWNKKKIVSEIGG
jgi:NADH dehydrogenase/NADH:ubiquinone oxidoreductase subunit G